jgi:hypothetical protein
MNYKPIKKFELEKEASWLTCPSKLTKDFQIALGACGVQTTQKIAKKILKLTTISFVYRLIAMSDRNKMLNL